jgi:hypothetical protein
VTQAAAGGTQPVATPGGGGAQLVTEGGFETPLKAPWGTGAFEPKGEIFWGTAQASATIANEGHSGSHALQITNNSDFAPQVFRTMSQQVAVVGGQAYCLSFWAKGQGTAAGILSMPVDKAWAHRVAVPGGSFGWTQFAGTATAEGSTFDIRLITDNKGTILVDDIELTSGACAHTGQLAAGTSPR